VRASTLAWLLGLAAPALADGDSGTCVSAHADAQLLRMHGALVEARGKLLACAQTDCPKPVAADCTAWLGEVEDSLSSVVFAVSDDAGNDLTDVSIRANGKPLADHADGRALTIDPGTYAFRFEASGYLPVDQSNSIRQSEKNRNVRVHMTRANPPPSAAKRTPPYTPAPLEIDTPATRSPAIPLASYILAGTTLLGLGAYAYFGLSGLAKEHKYQRLSHPNDCGSLCSDGKRDYVLADIGLGVGVASAVGAVTVFLLSRQSQDDDHEPPAHARFSVVPLPTSGAVAQWSEQF
jgi:hypothetical protein